jgi:Esterase/lipase
VDLALGEGGGARLVGYLHDLDDCEMPDPLLLHRFQRPCILICPGGGYAFLSPREAEPPAFAFFSHGYNVFILYYSVQGDACDMRPLIEISESVMAIRKNGAEWGVLPDQIAVCGFSAGAHLAASLGTLWDSARLRERMDTQDGQNRPNAMILCYPVITGGDFAHRGSFDQLTGGKNDPEEIDFYSLEKQVSGSMPPAFLWHTVEDKTVPVENTLLFAAALQKNGIPFECHIYPNGAHGMSLCNKEVNSSNSHCATWFPLCTEWLDELFRFEY